MRGRSDRVLVVRSIRGRATALARLGVKNFLGAFGHVALDYIITLRRLPRPNTSIEIVTRLGVKTALASFVGDDFPDDYRDALQREGVDLTDLRAIRGTATPTAWIFSDRAGNQMAVIDQGPMKDAARP